jgi:hypothetical protein
LGGRNKPSSARHLDRSIRAAIGVILTPPITLCGEDDADVVHRRFLRPDGGDVTIDDRASDDLDIRRRTGFVPERMNFDRRTSGRAFLRYMAKLAASIPLEARQCVH